MFHVEHCSSRMELACVRESAVELTIIAGIVLALMSLVVTVQAAGS